EEGHFGRKCPLLPFKTKISPPLQGGAIRLDLKQHYFLHGLNVQCAVKSVQYTPFARYYYLAKGVLGYSTSVIKAEL
ncbi:MAG: hypothetical protein II440_05540, partial [Clostridia bacterium]|nr:hypothetical protein [Clostridia bacterium]